MQRREDVRVHPPQEKRQRDRKNDRDVDRDDVLDRLFQIAVDLAAHGHGIHDQGALAGEVHHAAGGIERKQLAEVEVVEAHCRTRVPYLKTR